MSTGKHAPWRLRAYVESLERALQESTARDFLLFSDYTISAIPSHQIAIDGIALCADSLRIEFHQTVRILGAGDNPLVVLTKYRYHVHAEGVGPVLRYDPPHTDDHRPFDHVHTFETLTTGRETVDPIWRVEDIPLLNDVLEQAEAWHAVNAADLRARRLLKAS